MSDFGRENKQAKPSSSATIEVAMSKQTQKLTRPEGPLSPPISPDLVLVGTSESETTGAETTGARVADPTLYPEENVNDERPPLFDDEPSETKQVQGQAPRKSEDLHHPLQTNTVNGVTRMSFGTAAWTGAGAREGGDPVLQHIYALREKNKRIRQQLREQMRAEQGLADVQDGATAIQSAPTQSPAGPTAPARPARPHARNFKVAKRPSTVAQTSTFSRAVTASRKQRPTTGPAHKEKAAPKKKEVNFDFASLRDLSPDISTLKDRNALKVDAPANNPFDLQKDPHRDELDVAEVRLAASLRLSCAQYICSKRRIFLARFENLQNQKAFRKTDAQQACNIDVNKASKLWTAFDKVGWFDEHHFEHLV